MRVVIFSFLLLLVYSCMETRSPKVVVNIDCEQKFVLQDSVSAVIHQYIDIYSPKVVKITVRKDEDEILYVLSVAHYYSDFYRKGLYNSFKYKGTVILLYDVNNLFTFSDSASVSLEKT